MGATKLESADQIPSTPTAKTQVNEVVAVESEPSLQTPKSQETDDIFNELQSKSLKERMLSCKNHAELEQLKSENPELVTKVWDSLSIIEKNHIKCITKTEKQPPATLGYQFYYTDPASEVKYFAYYLGFYLHGETVEDGKRAILVGEKAIICDKTDLKPIPLKKQNKLPAYKIKELELILSNPETRTEPITEQEDTAPTPEEIATNTFTGLAPAPKQQTGTPTGNKPDSRQSEQSDGVKAGDLIEVHDKDSALNGKTVEVRYAKPDGTLNVVWEDKNYFVPASGYKIFSKGLGLKKA